MWRKNKMIDPLRVERLERTVRLVQEAQDRFEEELIYVRSLARNSMPRQDVKADYRTLQARIILLEQALEKLTGRKLHDGVNDGINALSEQ